MNSKLHGMYEQLIMLDEIAGELDPESNARIDAQRRELKGRILALEEDYYSIEMNPGA